MTQNSTSFLGDLSVSFLRNGEHDDARPWFLDLSFMAPHLPATVEPRYLDAVVPPLEPNSAMLEVDRSDKPGYVRRRRLRSFDDIQVRRVPALRSLVAVDDQVERIMRALDEMGELQNTVAVFVSDNGYLWGEHGRSKKAAPYLPAVEVPLYVRWPGHVAAGGIDTRLVGSLDIGPTMFAAAGVEAPSEFDGRNLLDRTTHRARTPPRIVADLGRTVVDRRAHQDMDLRGVRERSDEGRHVPRVLLDSRRPVSAREPSARRR